MDGTSLRLLMNISPQIYSLNILYNRILLKSVLGLRLLTYRRKIKTNRQKNRKWMITFLLHLYDLNLIFQPLCCVMRKWDATGKSKCMFKQIIYRLVNNSYPINQVIREHVIFFNDSEVRLDQLLFIPLIAILLQM